MKRFTTKRTKGDGDVFVLSDLSVVKTNSVLRTMVMS